MKIKTDFVTNSSSTSYVIDVNTPTLDADLFLLRLFSDEEFKYEMQSYSYDEDDNNKRLDKMKKELNQNYGFPLTEGSVSISFGDEDGTIIGRILDYCVRDGFSCAEFSIQFDHFNR